MASDSTILNNNGCAQAEDQQTKPQFSTPTSIYQCFRSCMNASLTFLVTMSIPAFYATLVMKDSVFGKRTPSLIIDEPHLVSGIKAAMSTWKELRSINGILLASVIHSSSAASNEPFDTITEHSLPPRSSHLPKSMRPFHSFIRHFIFDDTGRYGNDMFHHPDRFFFWLSKGLCTVN